MFVEWLKNKFYNEEEKEIEPEETPVIEQTPEIPEFKLSLEYSELLGINRNISFVITKSKVADVPEWNKLLDDCQNNFLRDLKRLGEDPEVINLAHKKLALSGRSTLLLVRVICDERSNVSLEFYRREKDTMLWNDGNENYPKAPNKKYNDIIVII